MLFEVCSSQSKIFYYVYVCNNFLEDLFKDGKLTQPCTFVFDLKFISFEEIR